MGRAHCGEGTLVGREAAEERKLMLANKTELQSEDPVPNLLTAGKDKSQLFPVNFGSAYLQNKDSSLPQGLL